MKTMKKLASLALAAAMSAAALPSFAAEAEVSVTPGEIQAAGTATAEQANETIGFIRKRISRAFGRGVASRVRIQYGGSMNAKNAAELMAMPEIDGGLIGGASLKADDFSVVVKAGLTEKNRA